MSNMICWNGEGIAISTKNLYNCPISPVYVKQIERLLYDFSMRNIF